MDVQGDVHDHPAVQALTVTAADVQHEGAGSVGEVAGLSSNKEMTMVEGRMVEMVIHGGQAQKQGVGRHCASHP